MIQLTNRELALLYAFTRHAWNDLSELRSVESLIPEELFNEVAGILARIERYFNITPPNNS